MSANHEISRIYDISLSDIKISGDNVRLTDPEKDLDQLAASIAIHGLLQPVVLEGEYGKPPYKLISGQRRFLAHERILKKEKILAVFAGTLTRTEAIIRSLVENLQRAELEYGDTSRAVTELFNELGTIDAVQESTGLSKKRIKDHLLIEARASTKMKSLLHEGKVSPADVKRALQAAQDDIQKAEELLDLIIAYSPTAHVKRRLIHYGNTSPAASAVEIFENAVKPHVEQKIVISISDELRGALEKATRSMEMEPSDLAEKVLSEWLKDQGFAV